MTADEIAALKREVERLREQLRIANIDALSLEAERNELAFKPGQSTAVIQQARISVQFGRVLSALIKEEYDRDPHIERFDHEADAFDEVLAKAKAES